MLKQSYLNNKHTRKSKFVQIQLQLDDEMILKHNYTQAQCHGGGGGGGGGTLALPLTRHNNRNQHTLNTDQVTIKHIHVCTSVLLPIQNLFAKYFNVANQVKEICL